MVTNVTAFGRSGLSDWLVQRVSAVILAVYVVGLLGWFACTPTVDYNAWQGLNACLGVRIANTLALLALIAHAWVGVWTILTDYVTSARMGSLGTALRIVFHLAALLWLFVSLVWGAVIIWAGV